MSPAPVVSMHDMPEDSGNPEALRAGLDETAAGAGLQNNMAYAAVQKSVRNVVPVGFAGQQRGFLIVGKQIIQAGETLPHIVEEFRRFLRFVISAQTVKAILPAPGGKRARAGRRR